MRLLKTFVLLIFSSMLFGQDTINFELINLKNSQFYTSSIIIDDLDENLYIKGVDEQFYSTNYDTINWKNFLLEDQFVRIMEKSKDGKLFAFTTSNDLWVKKDKIWKKFSNNLPQIGKPLWQKILCTNNNRVYIYTLFECYYSDDEGNSWTKNNDFNFINYSKKYVKHDGSIILQDYNRYWNSNDNGLSYKLMFPDSVLIYSFFVNEVTGKIYIAKFDGDFISTDGVKYLPLLNNNFPIGNDTLGWNYYFGNELLFKTNNENVTYDQYNSNLSNIGNQELYFDKKNRIYVITKNISNFENLYRSEKVNLKENNFLGHIFIDKNEDCKKDTSDYAFINSVIKIKNVIDDKTIYTSTDNAGKFQLYLDPGKYTISYNEIINNSILNCINDTITIESGKLIKDYVKLIKFRFCPQITFYSYTSTPVRKCIPLHNNILIKNWINYDIENVKLDIFLDDKLSLLSLSFPYVEVSKNHYLLDIGHINKLEDINLTDYIKVDCNSNIGDTVHINMKLCFYNTCKMANDTMFCSETRIVTNAYDPNNKIAFVNDKENNNSYKPSDKIEYIINFQNTGTDTAFRVVIKDKLSENLDLSTFEYQFSSHPCRYEIKNRELIFYFDPISLPDSNVNEKMSHGFVKFKINPIPTLKFNEKIDNEAFIYFDFNEAIVTNKVSLNYNNLLSNFDFLNNIKFYPNPSNSTVYFDLGNLPNEPMKFVLFNIYGQLILEKNIENERFQIDKPVDIQNGIYFFNLKMNNKNISSGKLFFY